MSRATREALEEALGDRVRFDVPMSRYTSLRVGGPADAVATPANREDVARVLQACAVRRVPHLTIGAGFNSLVRDGGIAGLVLHTGRMRELVDRPGGRVRAEAGVPHGRLTNFCVAHGYAGLEFAAGIPGTVGGWLAMNAGIPAREMKDAVAEVEIMAPTGSQRRHLGREALRFAYRGLRGLAPGSVILSVLFEIGLSESACVREEVNRHLRKRADTQPLQLPSCGSVFKNPRGDHAGRLIEAAGLKGLRIGGAEISTLHANFIVNQGGASASDVLALIAEAQRAVADKSGVRLEPEVRIVGRDS